MDIIALQELEELIRGGFVQSQGDYLGEGKDGIVYGIDNYAIKIFKESAKSSHDPYVLSKLQGTTLFPKLHLAKPGFMVTERINGLTLKNNDNLIKPSMDINKSIYFSKIIARKNGIEAFDLHKNNIMISENGDIKIVDVGRFKFINKASRHLISWTTSIDTPSWHVSSVWETTNNLR